MILPPRVQGLHGHSRISVRVKDHVLGGQGPEVVGNGVRPSAVCLDRQALKNLPALLRVPIVAPLLGSIVDSVARRTHSGRVAGTEVLGLIERVQVSRVVGGVVELIGE